MNHEMFAHQVDEVDVVVKFRSLSSYCTHKFHVGVCKTMTHNDSRRSHSCLKSGVKKAGKQIKFKFSAIRMLSCDFCDISH